MIRGGRAMRTRVSRARKITSRVNVRAEARARRRATRATRAARSPVLRVARALHKAESGRIKVAKATLDE